MPTQLRQQPLSVSQVMPDGQVSEVVQVLPQGRSPPGRPPPFPDLAPPPPFPDFAPPFPDLPPLPLFFLFLSPRVSPLMAPVVVFPPEARARRWVPSPSSEAWAARRGPITGSSADAEADATMTTMATMFAIKICIAASRFDFSCEKVYRPDPRRRRARRRLRQCVVASPSAPSTKDYTTGIGKRGFCSQSPAVPASPPRAPTLSVPQRS